MNIYEAEKPLGMIVQMGGQTPLNLADRLLEAGVPILGTSPKNIAAAEDREQFRVLLDKLELKQPESATARTLEEAEVIAHRIGFPVMIRPSFVLGGRAMMVAYEEEELEPFVNAAFAASPDHPVLLDRFLEHAIEVDVDVVCDGKDVYVGGVMEHVEEAGIHSGDSACSIPPYTLSDDIIERIKTACTAMALELNVKGLMNAQIAVKDDELYIIEVNPRASRTVPYVSKATNVPLANIATQIAMGKTIEELGLVGFEPKIEWFAIKEAVFPFNRFAGVDPILGPEMKSTGEVMGIDKTFELAFWKAEVAAGQVLPTEGAVFLSAKDRDKDWIVKVGQEFAELGFKLVATEGTAQALHNVGLEVLLTHKLSDDGKNVIDLMKESGVQLLVNTPSGPVARVDEIKIRSEAILRGLPIVTTQSGAEASVKAIKYIKENDWDVQAIQEYHAT
jgi:carbamoyl-phosphate synthase large subunit